MYELKNDLLSVLGVTDGRPFPPFVTNGICRQQDTYAPNNRPETCIVLSQMRFIDPET